LINTFASLGAGAQGRLDARDPADGRSQNRDAARADTLVSIDTFVQ
jgi:hypothetical protein